MLDDDYEMGNGAEVIRTLEYDDKDNDHDSRRSLQPALKHVGCSGIPMDWGLFSPAGLQKLCLRYEPKDGRPTIETLYGILLNSKDTLEHLDLSFVVGVHSGPVFELEKSLVLPQVTHPEVGFGCSHEARAVLQVFDFPLLRELTVESLTGWKRSDYVVEGVLRYVRVEELVELSLLWVDLFEDAAETLIRELVGRLSQGCLRRLTLDKCTDAFLRIMDYGKEGFLALLSGLEELSVRVSTNKESEDLVSLLHAILESGMVDGVYAGPTLEKVTITVAEIDLDAELERLDYLANEIRVTF
ncbi:hypothetical protein F5146DRAFT_1220859 [Armillaria mellea]|nr:hypothetical protein F5146DRAFT_1220859 [Armillaria mellea]